MRRYKSLVQNLKSKTSFLVLAVALVGLCSARLTDRANLSGHWKLNESKSDLGQFGARMATRKMIINQATDSLNMEATAPSLQGGEATRNETINFNGKEAETVLSPVAKKKSTAKWSDDGQTLTVNSTVSFDRGGEVVEAKLTEVWTMGDGGKTLTVLTTSVSSFGENTMKLVYDKDN